MRKLYLVTFFLIAIIISGCDNSEIIQEHINDPIYSSGNLEYYSNLNENDMENHAEKHIEVYGIVTTAGNKTFIIEKENEFEINVIFDESPSQTINEGDFIKIHGVCTSVFTDSMYIYGAKLSDYMSAEDYDNIGKIPVPGLQKDYEGMHYEDVINEFKKAGFTNIIPVQYDIDFNSEIDFEGVVEGVYIDGSSWNDTNEKFYPDDEVRIIYNSTPKIDFRDIGSYVPYGRYEQDGFTFRKDLIEWIVLDVKDDKVLLLSKHILDYKQFHESTQAEAKTWKDSSLRKWLNNDFLNEAFPYSWKDALTKTKITINDETTTDFVFLMSLDDVNKYKDIIFSKCEGATPYANSQSKYPESDWWLSTPESTDLFKRLANSYSISERTSRTNNDEGVRVAVWINIDKIDYDLLKN